MGPTRCAHGVRVPTSGVPYGTRATSGVPYVPRTVAPQEPQGRRARIALGRRGRREDGGGAEGLARAARGACGR
eukprot:scaffold47343_cov58-Phaeocystis_antarctica.AAC.2